MTAKYEAALVAPGVAAVYAPDNTTFCEMDDRAARLDSSLFRTDKGLLHDAQMIADMLNREYKLA